MKKLQRSARVRFSQFVLAEETLRRMYVALSPLGISFMPLKGVLVQRILYADPIERPIHDVDVLVRRQHFRRVAELLVRAGFSHRFTSESQGAVALTSPEGMDLDLHFRLFGPGRYRMSTDPVFARSYDDRSLFGVPVRLMDPYDLYSHAIGKIASDHVGAQHRQRFADLSRMPERLHLDPHAVANHLVMCGMRRAARHALPIAADTANDHFAAQVLQQLPEDPVGSVLVGAAARTIARTPQRSAPSVLAGHLLNHSLPRAGYAMGAAAVNRVRQRLATGLK